MVDQIGEALTAALLLVVGIGVISIMGGADPSLVSDLMRRGIVLIVYVAVAVIIAVVVLQLVRGA